MRVAGVHRAPVCNSTAVLTWQAQNAALCGSAEPPPQQPSWSPACPLGRCPASAQAPNDLGTVSLWCSRWRGAAGSCPATSGRSGSLALQRARLASGHARAARSGAAARAQVPQDVVHPQHGGAALVRLIRIPLWQRPPVRAGERLVDLRRTPPPSRARRAVLTHPSLQGSACMGHSMQRG